MRKGGNLLGAALLFLVTLTAALIGFAGPASAHADILFTTPEEGAVLAEAPAEINLTFSEPVLADTVVVSVEDETGFVVRVLDLRVDGADVFAAWPPGMPGTQFSVNYRVVSEDGHPVEGTLHFSLAAATPTAIGTASSAPTAGAVAPAAPSATGNDSSTPSILIPVLIGLAVGIVVGLVLYAVSRRSRRSAGGTSDADPDAAP